MVSFFVIFNSLQIQSISFWKFSSMWNIEKIPEFSLNIMLLRHFSHECQSEVIWGQYQKRHIFNLVTLNSTALLLNQNQTFFWITTQNAIFLIFSYFSLFLKWFEMYICILLLNFASEKIKKEHLEIVKSFFLLAE